MNADHQVVGLHVVDILVNQQFLICEYLLLASLQMYFQ